MGDSYEHLQVSTAEGVCTAVIASPPINLFSLELFGELARFAEAVSQDDAVRVVVLKSANPDFFIAHFDVAAILEMPVTRRRRAPIRRRGLPTISTACARPFAPWVRPPLLKSRAG